LRLPVDGQLSPVMLAKEFLWVVTVCFNPLDGVVNLRNVSICLLAVALEIQQG
jgi:hypothetical protein